MSGHGRGSGAGGAAIFVGNLPNDIREREVEDLFIKYGRVRSIDLKTPPRPPAFAFVEFDDPRDAQDAVRGRDGYDFFGNRIRVELSNGSREAGRGGGRGGGMGGPPPQTFRGRGTGFRALVKGLPISCSWQDLKDHFRQVVKPSYTNVFKERNGVLGVVEFDTREDLDRAIRKLDDTKFENPFDSAYVRVIDDSEGGGARRRSRSRSRGRSVSRGRNASSKKPVSIGRSYSRSASPHSRSRSRSVSKARSPAKSASRSPVRSASRSPSRSPARS